MTNPNEIIVPHEVKNKEGETIFISHGLTKREHFAAMAMQGILSNADGLKDIRRQGGDNWPKYEELVAGFCTLMADALIEALNKTEK